jgi:hypothetical protein
MNSTRIEYTEVVAVNEKAGGCALILLLPLFAQEQSDTAIV